jgi:uncharacterized protein YraI
MSRIPGLGSERGCSVLGIIGWAVAVILGIVLVFLGFVRPALERREAAQQTVAPQASPTQQAAVLPTAAPTLAPSPSPNPPTLTPLPTVALPTATPALANVVAGTDGVNVRTGPGTSFNKVGYIDPGVSARVIGRFSDWWQIDYNGSPAWVFGEMVSASNAEGVPQVQPPASPTPAPVVAPTATPQPVQPTLAPAPPTPTPQGGAAHGLKVNSFTVEDAPGPFKAENVKNSCGNDNHNIWYNMDLTVVGSSEVAFSILGAYVQESGYHKDSYTNADFNPGETFKWRDCLHIPTAGKYNIWLRICYSGGSCENLAGPVAVEVQ